MNSISFNSNKIKIGGYTYIPKNIKEGGKLPAIVVAHPFTSNKEQSLAICRKLLKD